MKPETDRRQSITGADERSDPSGGACYRKGVALLARRAHFAAELGRKLAARGFPAEQIDETLEVLAAQGYLDDVATARTFVDERRRRSGWGSVRLRAELARRGAGEAAAVVIGEVAEAEEGELARRAAERWRRQGGHNPAALARHLERKGFAPHVILRLVGETAAEE
jgi:regulatory protein